MPTVIYLDNQLLCLDKPGALLTQPSGTTCDSLEAQGKNLLRERFNKPGNVFLEAVHRIDAPACGIVLFARTSKALTRLNATMRNGLCRKEYRALVDGTPSADTATLRDWLVHDEHHARVVNAGSPAAKEAVLSYRVLEKHDGRTLLSVLLETGRYHQIRAQLAHVGLPIAGDTRYGAQSPWRIGCIALQHYRLTIRHPVTGADISFTSLLTL